MAKDLNSFFLYSNVEKEQRLFLERVLDLGISFVEGKEKDGRVFEYESISNLKSIFSERLPAVGMSYDDLYKTLKEKVVKYSIAQSDQRYLSFPDTGNSLSTFAADIIGSFLNQNLIAVDRSAPAATFVEMQLIIWLRQIVGYEYKEMHSEDLTLSDIGGMWTSGGNMSNHIAVLVALQNHFPRVRKEGLASLEKKPALIVAKGIEHFSFSSAASSLGIGENNILWASANDDYTTNLESVERAIEGCPSDKAPFMVVCVAGNCRTTNIDNIQGLRRLCDKHGLWLHVDACHGGSLLFSSKMKGFLEGIEAADSISLDPHKGLFVTYPSSYVLFRQSSILAKLSRYPDKAVSPECLDLGLIMPFYGSRGFHSLKLWMLIKHLGLEGLDNAIGARAQINSEMTKEMQKTNLFVLLNDNSFYRLAFVFFPKRVQEALNNLVDKKELSSVPQLINKYSDIFSQRLYQRGNVIFDHFSLLDLGNKIGFGRDARYTTLAMAIGHPYMKEEVKKDILREVSVIGEECESEMLDEISSLSSAASDRLMVSISPASW